MGWIVWLAESVLCLVASYLTAVAVYPDRGILDRLIATLLVATSLILVAIYACGLANMLAPWPLGVLSLVLFATVLVLALRSAGRERVFVVFRRDLGAPWRLVREAWQLREPAVLTIVTAAIVTGICCIMVWYFRSWTWDAVWYHVPKTYYAIQERTLRHISVPNPWTEGYPQHVEMLAVWNCIFPRDNRFDDSSQIPFLFLGAAAVAAWARRVGASRPFAASVGAAWITLPPVFLQAHSTHVDVAWSAMFTSAMYFMSGPPDRRDRWMCYISWGLFLGTKFTGAFHLALISPYLVWRIVQEIRRAHGQRWRRFGDVLLSVGLVLILGSFKYIQNMVVRGNPLYPFRWTLLGHTFPGVSTLAGEFGDGSARDPLFLGSPNALQNLVASWFDTDPFYAPDVRSGGFGPVFRYLLLPCVLLVTSDLVRLRNWRRSLLVVVFFVQALQVPAAVWPRFVIGAASASLVALAIVHTDLHSRLLRFVVSCALVVLTFVGYQDAFRGFIVFPRYLERARRADTVERAALQIDTFLWPTRWALQRERELQPGDVITYDQSVHFISDLFSHDYRTRVVYVPSDGDPQAFVHRVRSLNARWVGVQVDTPAERALQAAGAEYLFQTPLSTMAMYRMPRRNPADASFAVTRPPPTSVPPSP